MVGKEASAARVEVSETEPTVAVASTDMDALERAADSIRPSWDEAAAPLTAARVPDSFRPAFHEPEEPSYTPDFRQPVHATALAEVLARLSDNTIVVTAQHWFRRSPRLSTAGAALAVLTLGYALWPSSAPLAGPPPPPPPPQLAQALAHSAQDAPDTPEALEGTARGARARAADSAPVPPLDARSFEAPAARAQAKPTPQMLKEARAKAWRAKRREAAQAAPTKPAAKKKTNDSVSVNPYR